MRETKKRVPGQKLLFCYPPDGQTVSQRAKRKPLKPKASRPQSRTTTTMPQEQLLSNLGLILFATLPLYHWYRIWQVRKGQELKTYDGSCHCGEVCFTVKAAKHLVVWDCNCSICYMKKNWHFIVPAKDFRITSG